MKSQFPLFSQVVLLQDIPLYNLKRGEVATVVEHYPMPDEDGYSLEGLDVATVTIEVSASQITSLEKWQREIEIMEKLDRLSLENLIDLQVYLERLIAEKNQARLKVS